MSKTSADSRLARHLSTRPALGPFISLRLSYGHTPQHITANLNSLPRLW